MFCCNFIRSTADVNDAPWFDLRDQYIKCKIQSVYDGDTVTIIFPFRGKPYKSNCILAGIDTPEIRTKNNDEKTKGLETKNWLKDQIEGKMVWVFFGKNDKYGRPLVKIYKKESTDGCINDILVERNMAYIYDGKTKKKFEEWWKPY
jgi:micrococcal nuclease